MGAGPTDERQRPPSRARPAAPRRAAAHPPPPGPLRRRDHPAAGHHHRRRRLVARLRPLDADPRPARRGAGRAPSTCCRRPGSTPTAARSSGARTLPAGAVISTDPAAGEADPRHRRAARRLQGPGALPGRPRAGRAAVGRRRAELQEDLPEIAFTTAEQHDNDVPAGRGHRLRPAAPAPTSPRRGRHGVRQPGPRAGRRPRRHRADARAGRAATSRPRASRSSGARTGAAPPSTSARSWRDARPGRRHRSPSAAR